MHLSRLKKNVILNVCYQLLLMITPLITTPYLSRVLGADSIGLWAYTFSIAGYFLMFAMLGMSTYGVREVAECEGRGRMALSQTFSDLYSCQLLFAILAVAAYLVYAQCLGADHMLLTLIWIPYVTSSCFDVSWCLFGLNEFKLPTTVNSIVKLLEVAVILVFIKDPSDVWIYALAVGAGMLVAQFILWLKVLSKVGLVRPILQGVVRNIKPNLVLFVPVIAVSIYTSMDKIMLGLMAGMEQTGFYEYSERIVKFPLSAVVALGTVMLPHMTSKLSSNQRGEAMVTLRASFWIMMLVAIAFSFGIGSISPEFCPVFFGSGYDACIPLMVVLAPLIIIICASNVIGRQYMLPNHMDAKFTASLIVGAAVNFPINLVLISQWGALGASIGTLVAEFVVLFVQLVFVRKELPLKSYAVMTLPFFGAGVVMALAVRMFSVLAKSFLSSTLMVLVGEILVGALVYAVIMFVYCIATKDPMFQRLFSGFSKRLSR